MKKFLVIGDSITKGIIYDDARGRYVNCADGFINKLKNDDSLNIENVSLMGSTVTKGLSTLERLGSEVKQYDYTCVEFGGNDCNFTWSEVAESPDSHHDCATPLEKFREIYEKLIKKIRSLGSIPVAVSLPPIDSGKFYKWIIRGLNEDNIFSFIGEKERLARWQHDYNVAVREVAHKLNVPLVDITAPFDRASDRSALFCTDGIHPNGDGHRLIYNEIRTKYLPQLA